MESIFNMTALTVNKIEELCNAISSMPEFPSKCEASSINTLRQSGLWKQCRKSGTMPYITYGGLEISVNPVLPEDLIMLTYKDRYEFYPVNGEQPYSIPRIKMKYNEI